MEKFWYVIIGVILGFIICYFIHKDGGGGTFTCEENKILVQYCTDKTMVDYASIADIDITMKDYYQKALMNGDTVGFSLDKQLILNLAAYLSMDASSAGIRLYPGNNGSTNNVLVKPIDANGKERSNLGQIVELSTITGLGGPCPDWCNFDGRIIKP